MKLIALLLAGYITLGINFFAPSSSFAHNPRSWLASVQAKPQLKITKVFQGASVAINRIRFSQNGRLLVTADAHGVATIWTNKGVLLLQLSGQKPPMFNARFSADGEVVLTTGYDGTIRFWNLQGKLLKQEQAHQAAVADALFSPDGSRVVTSSDDGQTQILNNQNQKIGGIIKAGTARNLAYQAQGHIIASASDSGYLHLISPDGQLIREIPTEQGRINNVNFSPDGQKLVTSGIDGSVKIWNLQGNLITAIKSSSSGWTNAAHYHPNGQWLVTANDDGILRLWCDDGSLLTELSLGQTKLTSVTVSPDGHHLAVSSNQGKIWFIDLISQ